MLSFISAEMYFSKVVSLWANFRKVGAAEITKSYRYRIPNRNNNPIFFFFFFNPKGKKEIEFFQIFISSVMIIEKISGFHRNHQSLPLSYKQKQINQPSNLPLIQQQHARIKEDELQKWTMQS